MAVGWKRASSQTARSRTHGITDSGLFIGQSLYELESLTFQSHNITEITYSILYAYIQYTD